MKLEDFSRQIARMVQRTEGLCREVESSPRPDPLHSECVAELQASIEELRVAEDELRRQNLALTGAYMALDRERAHYRNLFMGAPIGYAVTTREGTISDINAAAAEMLGIRTTDAIGLPLQLFVAPSDRQGWTALLQRTATEANATAADVFTIRTFDRKRSTKCRVRVTRVLEQDGEPAGHRFVLGDLGMEERAERADRLSVESRNKDEFLAMLAHELRNPLAPIRAVVELWRHHAGDAEIGVDRGIEIIDRQVNHLTHLVDDLLDVSRVSLGKIRLRRKPLDVRDAVGHAVDALQASAQRHAMRVELPADPLWVDADPTRLRQIVTNLLDNAIKYTPSDGEIVVAARMEADRAIITVRDSGVGLPAEMLESVFELFTQGERTLARSQGGLGLGLTLVRRLVELHGGSVRASSDGPGHGSTFCVTLPLVEAPEVRVLSSESQVRRLRGRKLLVVDDNVDAAELLAAILSAEGHQIALAYDGMSAMETFERSHPEIVLLDLGLPDIDGLELARHFRVRDPCVMLVAVTGYGDDAMRARSREAGFHHHLLKPVDFDVLRQTLLEPMPAPAPRAPRGPDRSHA
jgi:PAS domain S-box-containing protein